MKHIHTASMLLALGMILMSILACSLVGNAAQKPEAASPTESAGKVEPNAAVNSKFPLPPKAKVIQSTDELVMATIDSPMKDVIEFYRQDARDKGLTEYDLLTSITDNTFSLVFHVPGQNKELVVQGTAIAEKNVAFSLRYEETDVN